MTMTKIPEIKTVSLDMFHDEIVPAGKAVVMRGAGQALRRGAIFLRR